MNDERFEKSHSKTGSRLMIGVFVFLLLMSAIVTFVVLGT